MHPKPSPSLLAVLFLGLALAPARAHDIGEGAHDHAAPRYDFTVQPPTRIVVRANDVVLLAQASAPRPVVAPASAQPSLLSSAFQPFAPKVKTRADGQFFYVESDGMPAHNMMVGITAWQQQVPLPQPYTGNSAWRIPLNPVPAQTPASIKNRFLRGAIALAANGIPIFNPQNNRGEISAEIGELDQWGGHCGRADDYHYHAAPLHLQSVLGKDKPIAFALDGYPIYGLTEPDGPAPTKLDAFNGHETAALGYHYHASLKYPYVNGGFHGEVVEREGQVDPQPRAGGMREASQALRGARITGFTAKDGKAFSLKYEVGTETRFVNYTLLDGGSVKFDFVDGRSQTRTETYSPRQRGPGGGDRPPGEPKGKDEKKKAPGKGGPPPPPPPPVRGEARPPGGPSGAVAAASYTPKRTGNFSLRSPAVANGGGLPVEFTGDGASATLPLEWTGAPAGTKSFAVFMDHLYVRAELDGVVYQEVPQPGHARGNPRSAEEYGYRTGVIQSPSGILRVTVSPDQSTVDHVRATLPSEEVGDRKKSAVTHSYRVGPRGAPNADFDPNAKPTKAVPKTGPTNKTP